MKLKMHSFDFGECTLTFSVPKEIMHSNSFGNVPGGVEVDLVAITRNAALEAKPEQHTTTVCQNAANTKESDNKQSAPFIKCDDCDELAEYHYCSECMDNHRN